MLYSPIPNRQRHPPTWVPDWINCYTQICYTPHTHLPICPHCTPGLLSPPPSAVRPQPRDSRVILGGQEGEFIFISFQVFYGIKFGNKGLKNRDQKFILAKITPAQEQEGVRRTRKGNKFFLNLCKILREKKVMSEGFEIGSKSLSQLMHFVVK